MYPPPNRPERRLWRWYRSLYPITQIILGFLVLIVMLSVCSLCASPDFVQSFQRGLALGAVAPTSTPVSNNGPRLGGQLSDFVNTYGSPTSTTTDSATFTGSDVQITASTDNSHVVTSVSVSGPSSWTIDASTAFCSQFLPDGAVETNRDNEDTVFIDYNSSMGKIVLQAQITTCLLFVGPSS